MSEEHVLSFQEIEQLSWYDLNAYLGIPYFHQGGMHATDRLADLCQVGPETRLLVVGCGTGYSACYIARTRGCQVVGFDLADHMVVKARERADAEGVADRVTFRVADAHTMPFEDGQFNVILTEFVSMFLDREKAFRECMRVLRPGGYLGVNELYKEDVIPESSSEKIGDAEEVFAEGTGFPFVMLTVSTWLKEFQAMGFVNIQSEKVDYEESLRERAQSVGGWRNLFRMIGRGFFYMFKSKEIRHKMLIQARFKRVLRQDKFTKQYLGALLCVGTKPINEFVTHR